MPRVFTCRGLPSEVRVVANLVPARRPLESCTGTGTRLTETFRCARAMAPSRPVARSRVGRKLPPAPLRLAHRCPRGDRNCLLTAQSRLVLPVVEQNFPEQKLAFLLQPLRSPRRRPTQVPARAIRHQPSSVACVCGCNMALRRCHRRTPAEALIRCLRDLSRLET